MHTVIIAFVVVEEGANLNSPRRNHTIAILNAGENDEVLSEALSEALEDIRAEIEQLKSLKVGDVEYSVEFFLGADCKFLALCIGLEAAIARYSCIWCVCPSEDRHDHWSINLLILDLRILDGIEKCKLQALDKSRATNVVK